MPVRHEPLATLDPCGWGTRTMAAVAAPTTEAPPPAPPAWPPPPDPLLSPPPPPTAPPPTTPYMCPICLDEDLPPDTHTRLGLCGHGACRNCMSTYYTRAILVDGIPFPRCVSPGCDRVAAEADVAAVVAPRTAARMRFLRGRHPGRGVDGSGLWCPAEGCWEVLPPPPLPTMARRRHGRCARGVAPPRVRCVGRARTRGRVRGWASAPPRGRRTRSGLPAASARVPIVARTSSGQAGVT